MRGTRASIYRRSGERQAFILLVVWCAVALLSSVYIISEYGRYFILLLAMGLFILSVERVLTMFDVVMKMKDDESEDDSLSDLTELPWK